MLVVLVQILLLVLLILYAVRLFRSGLDGKVISSWAVIILLMGLGLYMYAYSLEPYKEGGLTTFFRSLISSLKLFVYDNDLLEIHAAQKQPYFLEFFMFTYFAAMLTSASAIIMFFGKRLTTILRLRFRKVKFDHVFLGINSHSQVVASSIDENQEVAFVDFPCDREEVTGFKKILKNLVESSNKERFISDRRTVILHAKRNLSDCSGTEGIFNQTGLAGLSALTDGNTSYYLLSDSTDRNLKDILVLMEDEYFRNVTVHASLKREGLIKSYQQVLGNTGAHFIYPSSLSVVDLISDPESQPAMMMPVDANGAASGEFNAFVLGFGETGQAVTKFLYEMSAAVTSDGGELPVHISVADDNITRLKMGFTISSPALKEGVVTFENCGVASGEYVKKIVDNIDSLNYIALTMPDDAGNLETACDLYNYALTRRKDGLGNFKIVVRMHHVSEAERKLISRLNSDAGHAVIRYFGEESKIFTSEMIVSGKNGGINSKASSIADSLEAEYLSVAGENAVYGQAGVEAGSYSDKRRRRREVHHFISLGNHIPSKLHFTHGRTQVSARELENLAICEHIRNVRYLVIHGYTPAGNDDDVRKTNHLICRWSELSAQDKQFYRDLATASLSFAGKSES